MIPESLVGTVFPGPVEDLFPLLPSNSIDCIFADPDYNVGVSYQGKRYTKRFDDYIDWCVGWAKESHRVLNERGNFFIVNYGKNNAHLRARYLDSAFSKVYEYVWAYNTNIGQGRGHFTPAHRIILHCTKSPDNRFYKAAVAEPYKNPTDRRIRKLISGGSPGRMPYTWQVGMPNQDPDQSWMSINLVKNVSRSKTFHSCQLPEHLSEKLFRATTRPGDSVLVLFAGAGSELAVCERLGLKWVSAEIVPEYRELVYSRLRRGGAVEPKDRMMSAIRARQRTLESSLPKRAAKTSS